MSCAWHPAVPGLLWGLGSAVGGALNYQAAPGLAEAPLDEGTQSLFQFILERGLVDFFYFL